MCVYARACVPAYVRACVVRACVRACVCVCDIIIFCVCLRHKSGVISFSVRPVLVQVIQGNKSLRVTDVASSN